MAITKLQIRKAYHLLDNSNLTLGQIQNLVIVERIIKKGKKPKEGTDLRPIVRTIRRVKGTGIPASTLSRLKSREIKLGRTSAKKLASMYDRLMFQKLRGSGVNQKEARRLKSSSPDEIRRITSNYLKNAKKIQFHYEEKYRQAVKDFKHQSKQKPKALPKPRPKRPHIPSPEEAFYGKREDTDIPDLESQFTGSTQDTYLDLEDEEETVDVPTPEPSPLTEPPLNDYPTLDEVIFGMSISDHLESEWDHIALYKGDK